ncbi:MAG: transketolase, N-terminal subunit [Dehalococcoidia bacterium]|nr:transketolase, N-terminal subunit [Dehalococcoidia bacterium]
MTNSPSLEELKKLAWQTRRDILIMLEKAGSGHPGGSLSAVEILMSKGHGCPVLYTVLANRGFFPKEDLMTFRKLGSRLQGHAFRGVPGVEVSSGSLGQGLSIANGMAVVAKNDKRDTRVYCLMGDGEMDEGQIWEAAMAASFYKLDNLCGIVDRNQVQQNGPTKLIKDLEPVADKWKACGWHVIDINGHDALQVIKAYDEAESIKGRPTVVMANTIKGKGVSFMEGNHQWHGKAPNKAELEAALKELDAAQGVR